MFYIIPYVSAYHVFDFVLFYLMLNKSSHATPDVLFAIL